MANSFSKLKEGMTPERLNNVENRANEILLEMALKELRNEKNLTQQKLASILEVNQAALSKIESQSDIKVSTLRRLLEAMGGSLKLVAEFPEGEIVINQF